MVSAIAAVSEGPLGRGIAIPNRNISGKNATSASSTCWEVPCSAATASPAIAMNAASRIGRTVSYMRNSSCRHTKPSTRIPIANTQPPAAMMKTA